jgi:hypothetical protein
VSATTAAMEVAANVGRDRDAAILQLEGKRATRDYDVFLCYSSHDRKAVTEIGEKLKERGLLPWLDIWEQKPGKNWLRMLERQLRRIRTAAVFIGSGRGPWQNAELDALVRRFVKRRKTVIPVFLRGAAAQPRLPVFLESLAPVDLRGAKSQAFEQLVQAITGDDDIPF